MRDISYRAIVLNVIFISSISITTIHCTQTLPIFGVGLLPYHKVALIHGVMVPTATVHVETMLSSIGGAFTLHHSGFASF